MSRTYRKNPRWFYKYKGDFYSVSRSDITLKNDVCIQIHRVWDTFDSSMWGGGFYKEVIVSDSDTFGAYCNGAWKRTYRRIDRARYKQALLKEDSHIRPSYDPWDWD